MVNVLQQFKVVKDLSPALSALHDLVSSLCNWFVRTLKLLQQQNGFNNGSNVFDGYEVIEMLNVECGLNKDSIDVFEGYVPSMREDDINNFLNNLDTDSGIASLEYDEERKEKEEKKELGEDAIYIIKKILLTYRFLLSNTDAYSLVLKCDDPNTSTAARFNRRRNNDKSDMDRLYHATFNLW